MSRRKGHQRPEATPAPTQTYGSRLDIWPASMREASGAVAPHLRCPRCWTGLGRKAERRKWRPQVNGRLVSAATFAISVAANGL